MFIETVHPCTYVYVLVSEALKNYWGAGNDGEMVH